MTESKQFRHGNDGLIVFDHGKGSIYIGNLWGQGEFFLERASALNLASHLLQWATQQPQDALGSDYDESDESIRADD